MLRQSINHEFCFTSYYNVSTNKYTYLYKRNSLTIIYNTALEITSFELFVKFERSHITFLPDKVSNLIMNHVNVFAICEKLRHCHSSIKKQDS